MKKILLFLVVLFISVAARAQDFPYGQVDASDLDMKKYDKDTSAHAVVLNEHGISRIAVTGDDEIRLVYDYHVKIKFFDNKDFEQEGTIEIPIYSSDSQTYEEISDIKGITYYKDDSGNIQKIELDRSKVFKVKNDNHYSTWKFAMPGLRKGCIIEFKYQVKSPYIYNFHNWLFQGGIPKQYSEYESFIPAFWNFNASIRGYLKLTTQKADLDRECFSFRGAKADCSHLTYGIKDIPAFVEEDYMTSIKNFLSGIYFTLIEETNFSTGAKTKYSKDWRDVDYDLKTANEFGGQLKKKDLMKERVTPVIANKTDTLEKAKAVYSYLQKTFKWNENGGIFSVDGIRKALDSHSGNSADINLALVTALNSIKIPAEAVLLSTREHGSINKLYPGYSDFDYVVAKTTIGGKTYLLDATDPLLTFGMLPMRCLNDQGRVFSLDKPSYWIDMVTLQRENVTYAIDLTLQDNGKLKGTITRYSIGYSGYLKRKEIKKFNSLDEYVENIGEKMHKTKILKANIINVDSLESAVGETYDVEMDVYDNLNHDRLSFSPYLMNQIVNNPFKLAERDFPVDWGMASDDRYIMSIHLPSQYVVENPMKPVSFSMPNQGGKFYTNFEGDNNTFTFSYGIRFNKSFYGPEEYPYLKELYNKIILAEKDEMIFKKK